MNEGRLFILAPNMRVGLEHAGRAGLARPDLGRGFIILTQLHQACGLRVTPQDDVVDLGCSEALRQEFELSRQLGAVIYPDLSTPDKVLAYVLECAEGDAS